MTMRVQVLYFGVLRESLGGAGEAVELPAGSTVGDLLCLYRHRERLRPGLLETLAVAVNREYAQAADGLRDGDEVALLPPVSGGLG